MQNVRPTAESPPLEARDRLAVLGGFVTAPPSMPHGSWQASYRMCTAIARAGRYRSIDVFHENVLQRRSQVTLPDGPSCRLLERTSLRESPGHYSAIYVANGEQAEYLPHELRADHDPAPVVCEIGTAHYPRQWTNLFLSAWNGTMRSTDGFIFKARAVQTLYRGVWEDWNTRVDDLPFPRSAVIPNGVDLQGNRRSEALRSETRRQLRLSDDDVVFLTFSRLSPGTKGDYRALLFIWKQVIEKYRNAILLLSGKGIDTTFLLQLRSIIRQAGLGANVLMAEDPYDVWPSDARERLMATADVFIHLTTGAQEVSPNSVLEAMAHGLPVIVTAWAGLPEVVEEGGNGFLVATHPCDPPPFLQRLMLSRDPAYTNHDLGRCVGCDGQAVIRAVSLLMSDPGLRNDMGHRSRQRAERHFGLDAIAARRIAFLDELAEEARRSEPSGRVRELVSFRSLLRTMGSRPFAPDDLVELVRPEAFAFAHTGAPDDAMIDLLESVLLETSPLPLDEVVRRAQTLAGSFLIDADQPLPPEVWRPCTRVMARLASYGAIRVLPAP
jgi:glycosyltransferase involved in cell wall biosynthesis